MKTERSRKSRGGLALFVLVAGWATPLAANDQKPFPRWSREEVLRMARTHEERGKALQADELKNPDKAWGRKQAFLAAARWVAIDLVYWANDPSSSNYLTQTFRFGLNQEHAGNIDQAENAYWLCLEHRLAETPGVDEDGRPVAVRVRKRLDALGRQKPAASRRRDRPEPRITFVSGRGGTRLHHDFRGAYRGYTPTETMDIALRQGLFALDRDQAKAAQKVRIERAGLSCMEIANGEIIVFAVSAPGKSTDRAAELSKALTQFRADLNRAYFDRRPADPLPLVVYACLGGEEEGRRLSEALHFRPRDGLEGYYEPLDHSVVLRKGLVGKERLPLGTAFHMVSRALIRADFSEAPAWLAEGMASLQKVRDAQGPADNYQLYYLLDAMTYQKLPTLEQLVDETNPDWDGPMAPILRAMARYLAFYLKSGVPAVDRLQEVYRSLRDGRAASGGAPGAVSVLEQVTKRDADTLQADFEQFIQGREAAYAQSTWNTYRGSFTSYVMSLDGPSDPESPSTENDLPPSAAAPEPVTPIINNRSPADLEAEAERRAALRTLWERAARTVDLWLKAQVDARFAEMIGIVEEWKKVRVELDAKQRAADLDALLAAPNSGASSVAASERRRHNKTYQDRIDQHRREMEAAADLRHRFRRAVLDLEDTLGRASDGCKMKQNLEEIRKLIGP